MRGELRPRVGPQRARCESVLRAGLREEVLGESHDASLVAIKAFQG
jgi:hypothetical protein